MVDSKHLLIGITEMMNFRRGFFRLWVVASALWVLGILLFLPVLWEADMWFLLGAAAFFPPIAVYVTIRILVGVLTWVFMGFATSPPVLRDWVGLGRVAGIFGKVSVSYGPVIHWRVIQLRIWVVDLLKELGESILFVAIMVGTGYLLWPLIGRWIEQREAFPEIVRNFEKFLSSPLGRFFFDTGWKVTGWKIIAMIGILLLLYDLAQMCLNARVEWAPQNPWLTIGKTQCEHCEQWYKNKAAAARCCLSEPPTPLWIHRNKLLDKRDALKRAAVFAYSFPFLWTGLAALFEIAVFKWGWFWTTAGLSCAVGYGVYFKEYQLQVQCSECSSFRMHNTATFYEAERKRYIQLLAGVKTARPRLSGSSPFIEQPLCSRCFAGRVQRYEEEELRRER